MGDLTINLSRSEFACRCGCGYDTVDFDLVFVLQKSRDYFQSKHINKDIRMHINSGTRCAKHNAEEGGAPTSKHLQARAADYYLYDKLTGEHLDDNLLADYLEQTYPTRYGIGRYVGRTHVDTRSDKARWDQR